VERDGCCEARRSEYDMTERHLFGSVIEVEVLAVVDGELGG